MGAAARASGTTVRAVDAGRRTAQNDFRPFAPSAPRSHSRRQVGGKRGEQGKVLLNNNQPQSATRRESTDQPTVRLASLAPGFVGARTSDVVERCSTTSLTEVNLCTSMVANY